MSLQMRKTSSEWYAQISVEGERKVVKLGVDIRGCRPQSIRDTGDAEFEKSRREAQEAHDKLVAEIESDRHGLQAARNVVLIKTGRDIEFPKIKELADKWEQLPRRKIPSDRYVDLCRSRLQAFSGWMGNRYKDVSELAGVTYDMALEYMNEQEERGVSAKNYNDTLQLLKSAYSKLQPDIESSRNPFGRIPSKAAETVGRRPFTPEQLQSIISVVKNDPLMRPLVITGICTAMRLGDCAKLEWKNIDLEEGFICVKTGKTGQGAEIPILGYLRKELEAAPTSDGYVFPDLAKMYRSGPDKLSYRFKKVLVEAGILVPPQEICSSGSNSSDRLPEKELRARAYKLLDEYEAPTNNPSKPDKMRKVLDMYLDGRNIPEIAKELKLSRGSVSNYLNELEDKIETAIITRRGPGVRKVEAPDTDTRGQRQRRPSIYGFHSLRTTWVTIMLNQGLPMDLVKRVTGHTTVDTVLKHYFKPNRDNLRKQVSELVPYLLPDQGKMDNAEQSVKQLLAGATEENAWEIIQTARKILKL